MLRPSIFQVAANDDFTVDVYFDDGRVKVFDAKPLIGMGGIYSRLADKEFFVERCLILNRTLAWDTADNFSTDECIDVCPDFIYETCVDLAAERVG